MDASKRSKPGVWVALLWLAWPLSASASDTNVDRADDASVPPVPAVLGPVVPEGALAALRGGDASVVVSVDNHGNVSGNSASDLVSGGNHVGEGAFAHAAGLATVIQNSGSNVLIQNGTSVNVRFGDPGR
ncbi:hypothetical protein FZO89_03195 [Luteimonas viscosa]|uniref:Uncharacterized protein n=1 Tax=Luteimonas viscosa TaxID=1132694 RepID=A0A5D4XQX9_9GAMM|nr:hypothetical protein [Luteimonas viscosa]TYT25352.1 hypothetical protein FZO89_03195 [Luteimonas viscosa]